MSCLLYDGDERSEEFGGDSCDETVSDGGVAGDVSGAVFGAYEVVVECCEFFGFGEERVVVVDGVTACFGEPYFDAGEQFRVGAHEFGEFFEFVGGGELVY